MAFAVAFYVMLRPARLNFVLCIVQVSLSLFYIRYIRSLYPSTAPCISNHAQKRNAKGFRISHPRWLGRATMGFCFSTHVRLRGVGI